MVFSNEEIMVKSIDPRRETLSMLWRARMGSGGILRAHHERRMIGVDVRGLNVDKALGVV